MGLSIVLICLAGCFASNPEDIQVFRKPEEVMLPESEYILQPPDEIEIHCSRVPEIHLQIQQIRPDGKVTFEGIGEIRAAGKTPEQLTKEMREKIMTLYNLAGEHPINVRIVTYQSKAYYVWGQVFFPGPKIITGRDTVLKAVAEARPTTLAWLERVQVVRPSSNPNVRPRVFELNYRDMTERGDTTKNVYLEEGDIVFIPPTVLAGIGLKVEEFISPIGRAFSTVNIVQGPPGRRN